MAGALYPSSGLDRERGFPDIVARWSAYRASTRDVEDFLRATGVRQVQTPYLPLLYLHTIGFRLQMAILTHPAFPVPIWRVLQVRNRLLQHRPIGADEPLDLETRIETHRVTGKGLEVDLHTKVLGRKLPVWESLNTFYVRGRFGPPDASSLLAQVPAVAAGTVAQWHMPAGSRFRFAALTGDYNGLHLWNAYAKRLGFKAAFFHTQRVLGHCLAHLGAVQENEPQRLDAWLKGPVYYDSDVRLCAVEETRGAAFALFSREEERPAVVGRIRNVPAPAALLRSADAGDA